MQFLFILGVALLVLRAINAVKIPVWFSLLLVFSYPICYIFVMIMIFMYG